MKTEKLLSFHGDPAIKEKFVKRVEAHYKADEIIKGIYWEKGKGCAVGCTVHSNMHDDYEIELGITWRLALVEDSIFEKLPNDQAKEFPMQFLKSMPVGVDTNIIFKKFVLWNLVDDKHGLVHHIKNQEAISFLKEVAEMYQRSFTEEIKQEEWQKLADRAASASASAYAYAYAYASAYASAYAYAYAYAEWQQKFNERILSMRDKLMELIIAIDKE